jgi:hypothetical protein
MAMKNEKYESALDVISITVFAFAVIYWLLENA